MTARVWVSRDRGSSGAPTRMAMFRGAKPELVAGEWLPTAGCRFCDSWREGEHLGTLGLAPGQCRRMRLAMGTVGVAVMSCRDTDGYYMPVACGLGAAEAEAEYKAWQARHDPAGWSHYEFSSMDTVTLDLDGGGGS